MYQGHWCYARKNTNAKVFLRKKNKEFKFDVRINYKQKMSYFDPQTIIIVAGVSRANVTEETLASVAATR